MIRKDVEKIALEHGLYRDRPGPASDYKLIPKQWRYSTLGTILNLTWRREALLGKP